MRNVRWITILGSCLVVVSVVAACVPAAAPGTAGEPTPTASEAATVVEAVPAKAGDQVDVQVNAGTATLDITSQTGIGGADVMVVSGPYPVGIVFRLHLKGLEQFTLAYDNTMIRVAVASDGTNQVWQSLIQDGVEQPLTAESPYWLPVTVTVAGGTDSATLAEKTYVLKAPTDLLQRQPSRFKIDWIDFFR